VAIFFRRALLQVISEFSSMSELIQIGSANERPKAPRPEDVQPRFSPNAIAELEALKTHYPEEKACILPALWIAQREYGGHLPGEAIAEVALRLNRPYAEIEGVATFYSMYNTEHKPGRHKIEVCTCLTCHVCGAYRIFDYLKQKLGVGNMETTPDGMFMLEEVECLDACDRAPLLQIGDEYHGPVDEAYVDKLLDHLRNSSESTVIKLADEVVQVHLRDAERPAQS
jgi:NADH-quinone oxidoreductase E subunit